jgi:hypothetical protein
MNPLTRAGLWLVLLLVWSGSSFYGGDRWRNSAWLAKQAVQQQAALKQLQAEQARGDALSTGLLTQAAQIDQLKEEAQHAIATATTGRTCLDSAALRVLQHAPGITLVPTTTSGAAAADGAPAALADGGAWYSTDTQLASWAIETAAGYETCRTRLDALIDWHEKP